MIGIVVTITFMMSGALSFMNEDSAEHIAAWYWGFYAALGSIYCVGFFIWDEYDKLWRNWLALIILTSLGLSVMAFVRFQGLILFLLMPITMQSVLFLSRRGAILFTLGIVLLINLIPYSVFPNIFSIQVSLWISNFVTIGGLYGVGVVIQIALIEQFRARAEVEYLNEQLRDYAQQSAALAASEERNRMAHTIHDSIGHALTVVSVQLEAAERLIEREEIAKASHAIYNARQVTREGLSQVRTSIRGLKYDGLDVSDKLSHALQTLLSRVMRDDCTTSFKASTDVLTHLDALPQQTQRIILRSMQEGLTNALKHASPTEILLTIEIIQQTMQLMLTNDAPHMQSGFGNRIGLQNIRKSVQEIGGTVTIQSLADCFILKIEIPYEQ
ncbi:MAG: histidine kinase [Phototrophicaceae bacterium]